MFKVVKISQEFTGTRNCAPSHSHVVVGGIDTKESALILAEVAASEHADAIMTDYKPCGNLRKEQTGFTFRTSNGTDVWYVVKAER